MPNKLKRGCFAIHSIHDILLNTYVTKMHWLQELEIRVYYIVEKCREVIRYVSAQTAFNNKRKRKRNEWKKTVKKKPNRLWTRGEIPSFVA